LKTSDRRRKMRIRSKKEIGKEDDNKATMNTKNEDAADIQTFNLD
jgi:hypothetical protein